MTGVQTCALPICFESVDCQISGLGRIADVQQLYIAHTKAAMDLLNG